MRKMGVLNYLLVLFSLKVTSLVDDAQGSVRFTVVPPSVLYVSSGGTARFVWDYSVDNRFDEFDVFSPRWFFYDASDRDFLIGQENVFHKRKWFVSTPTCPARLLNPTRVSKESNATLVIHNVTMADSGTYGCTLVLSTGNPITSKAQLVVISTPRFTSNQTPSTMKSEYQDLNINCSADGVPNPNITWVKVQGVTMMIKIQGMQKATLSIPNITRHERGIYNCCATNNPNEKPICRSTTVTVMYKPEINSINSSIVLLSSHGNSISLRCLADGEPAPLITWYDPRGKQITRGMSNITGGSVLKIIKDDIVQYGLYRCKAENKIGYDEHLINVTKTFYTLSPTSKRLATRTSHVYETESIPTSSKETYSKKAAGGEKSKINKDVNVVMIGSAVISILIIAIVVLIVVIWRKHGNDKDTAHEGQPRARGNEVEENDKPIYAQVDYSKKKKNRSQDEMPIYAQVDKSKKKRPGQIIYAELEDLKRSEEIPSSFIPPSCSSSKYAEINLQNGKDSEPIYEIL